ncbi:hypothetical protein EDB92DRAFT_1815595 [Lactarius akahatsu]|uniref:Uncharacterized protein n=1 Tax=Lactarius akahatsu TaxID=416441 RepID=A0AAD4LJK7_9AGAM|nr:hypothetical protein EDB92DRAFT_1815595 [Lactarius akahatsu]
MKELNHIIDEEMPGRLKFKCEKICIGGESYDFHFREVIPCIRALFGDPRYSGHLYLHTERHYRDAGCTTQVFGEMYTGKWWWSVQQSLELRKPGATQAQMLMGYIPATQLKQITNQAARRRALGNLFHSCMRKLLNPIESYGVTGIAMATGDGIWYRCHPILATFIGDYPEQLLITCTYNRSAPSALYHKANLEPTQDSLCVTSAAVGVLKHLVRWLAALRSGEITRDAAVYHRTTMPDTFTKASPGSQAHR